MRLIRVFSALLLAAIAAPASSQSYNAFETHDEAARRRQAERYDEEKNRQNPVTQQRTRPLGEAAPSQFSNPPVNRGTSPGQCPRNQAGCR